MFDNIAGDDNVTSFSNNGAISWSKNKSRPIEKFVTCGVFIF